MLLHLKTLPVPGNMLSLFGYTGAQEQVTGWIIQSQWQFTDGVNSGSDLMDQEVLDFFTQHPLTAPVFNALQLSSKTFLVDKASNEKHPPGCLLFDQSQQRIYLGKFQEVLESLSNQTRALQSDVHNQPIGRAKRLKIIKNFIESVSEVEHKGAF